MTHRSRTLYRQVYFHGVRLLLLVAAALALAGFFLGRHSRWRWHPSPLVQHVGGDLAPLPDEALHDPVARMAEELDADLAVYAADGRLLASAGTRVPPPLGRDQAARVAAHGEPTRHGPHGASAGAGPARYVRLSARRPEIDALLRLLGTLGLVVAVLALASAPLARAIVRPIEHLGLVARRLGEGDLGARSGLDRTDEIGALARTFDEMAERLGRLLEGQRELLANVSHELRTPLARVRVTLGLAAEAPPGEVHRHLQEIERDVEELERLVADVLTAARLDGGGGLVLRREPVDLEEVVGEAVSRFRRHDPGRPVQVGAEGSHVVEAEPALLARVFDNLLHNAAKYSDPQSPIGVDVEPREGGVVAVVRDRGMGISAEDQARVFEPFFRGDRSRARDTGGVGLGLALSKRIVEAHGGRISLESAVGRGTTVTVWLPGRAPR